MLRALLLIFDPGNSWERIETAKPSVARVSFMYVLPILVVSLAAEGWLIARFGIQSGGVVRRSMLVSKEVLVRYEVAQFVLGLLICFGGAWLIQKLSESFHRKHPYRECFAILGYSLGPYFLCRILDGWPELNTWVAWAIGAVLALSLFYRGLPRVLRPDPSNALGVYLMSALIILVPPGLAHFVATLILDEKILHAAYFLPS